MSEFCAEHAQRGELTYVHCKAGRGRSTTLVLCYLIRQMQMSPEEAYAFVQAKRPQVCLAEGQWAAVREVVPDVIHLHTPVLLLHGAVVDFVQNNAASDSWWRSACVLVLPACIYYYQNQNAACSEDAFTYVWAVAHKLIAYRGCILRNPTCAVPQELPGGTSS